LQRDAGRARPPYHPYTEALLAAVPRPDPTARAPYVALTGELPSPREVPRGCAFATRCPRSLGAICRDQPPPARRSDDGTHVLHCHIPRAELADLQRDLLPGNEAS
jgi:oligopeptide/dipeptide ABC transporter, ATP-binding protein, C-terminal domain